MDFGLKELGITFMVGAFTILGFELVLYHLLAVSVTGFFRERLGFENSDNEKKTKRLGGRPFHNKSLRANRKSTDDSFHSMRLAVFIGFSFAIGILAEDISYKFVDNEFPFSLEPNYD